MWFVIVGLPVLFCISVPVIGFLIHYIRKRNAARALEKYLYPAISLLRSLSNQHSAANR